MLVSIISRYYTVCSSTCKSKYLKKSKEYGRHLYYDHFERREKEKKREKIVYIQSIVLQCQYIDLLYNIKFPIILVHSRSINSSANTSSFNNLYEEMHKAFSGFTKKQQDLL